MDFNPESQETRMDVGNEVSFLLHLHNAAHLSHSGEIDNGVTSSR